ncbi:DNA helicase [Caulobacter phage Jess A]|nr:DNA helicase [Caulobacter phage Jess A]QNH91681.1 DNA helicase [Caulobacter phage SR18]WCA46438.1 DNA helicase [Caulobacter phage RapA]
MKFKPHAYQGLIIDHACDLRRSNIWAGMGMGKTVSTLTALAALDVVAEGPTLVLAPKRVAVTTWPEEAQKWDHLGVLRVEPVTGTSAQRAKALKLDANVFTMAYDNLPWLGAHLKELGKPWPFTSVISDESTRLKSFRTRQGGQRAKVLGAVAHTQVKDWTNLTGTPAPNGLEDLWGQNWFVDGGVRLGRTWTDFNDRWFQTRNEKGTWAKNPNFQVPVKRPVEWAQEQIEDALRDVTVSLKAADWFDIKEPIVRKVEIELPGRARALYKDMARNFYMQLGSREIEAANAGVKSGKLLQLASGATYTEGREWEAVHDLKLEALDSIIQEAAGMPVLVAYHWNHSLQRIKHAFKYARELDDDPATQKLWNAGRIPLLVAHPKSCGHGLNLQDGGNILVFFDHWWDLEGHEQIIERIGPTRQLQSGHNRPVFVYYIVARRTEDERVLLRHSSKRSVMDLLMDAMRKGETYA